MKTELFFQHFGHTEEFKIYDIEDGKILKSVIVDTQGQGHGALADFLSSAKVDALICGGIGGGAQQALKNAAIELYGGVRGMADDAVEALLDGKLVPIENPTCAGHDHGHGEGHSCGNQEKATPAGIMETAMNMLAAATAAISRHHESVNGNF